MSITATLALEIGRLKSQLGEARKELRSFKGAAEKEGRGMGNAMFGGVQSALAGLSLAGAATGIKSVLSNFDDVADTALKLGETTEVVQRVGAAAALSGSSVEGLAGATLKLEKALGEAGNEKAAAALEHYGITAAQLTALPLDEKILVLSEAFQKARTEGTGYNDLLALMGKSAGELIPLLSGSREELQALFAGAAVVDDAQVQQLAALNDQFDLMVQHAKAFVAVNISDAFKGFDFFKDVIANHVVGVQVALKGGGLGGLNPLKNIDDANTAAGEKDYADALAAKARTAKIESDRKLKAAAVKAANTEAPFEPVIEDPEEREKKAAAAAEKRAAALKKAAEAEREFLDPTGKTEALKQELRGIFDKAGVEMGNLAKLKEADPEAYADALKNIKEGAGSTGGRMGQSVGTLQNAVNVLTGRGANQIAEEQRDLARDANDYLKSIDQKLNPQPTQPTVPVFAFP